MTVPTVTYRERWNTGTLNKRESQHAMSPRRHPRHRRYNPNHTAQPSKPTPTAPQPLTRRYIEHLARSLVRRHLATRDILEGTTTTHSEQDAS